MNRTAVILYVIWAWQFLVACFMEYVTMIDYLFSGFMGSPRENEAMLLWFGFLSVLLAGTIIAEGYRFANERLPAETYLSLQVGKTAYISVAWGLRGPKLFKYNHDWEDVWLMVIYFGCWVLMLGHAIVVKWMGKRVMSDGEKRILLGSVGRK